MRNTFAQSYLIDILGRQLLLNPEHIAEVNFGLEMALRELDEAPVGVPLERLAEALENTTHTETIAVINLLNMPPGSLWVREALLEARRHLSGLERAQVVIVGAWQLLKGRAGRRTKTVENRFIEWKSFVESQLRGSRVGELLITWVG